MATQLTLIESPKDWKLSPEVKEIARRGLASARAALAASAPSDASGRRAA